MGLRSRQVLPTGVLPCVRPRRASGTGWCGTAFSASRPSFLGVSSLPQTRHVYGSSRPPWRPFALLSWTPSRQLPSLRCKHAARLWLSVPFRVVATYLSLELVCCCCGCLHSPPPRQQRTTLTPGCALLSDLGNILANGPAILIATLVSGQMLRACV